MKKMEVENIAGLIREAIEMGIRVKKE